MKRVISFITVLVMIMAMMVVPASAASVFGTNDVDPPSPNIYHIGDQIDYVMTLTNTDGTETMIVDIWSVLPDGSEPFRFTDVAIAPGEIVTYTSMYIVDEADLVSLSGIYNGVINEFHAEGTQGLDNVDVFVDKSSLVIMPEITIMKTVDFNGDGTFNNYEMYYPSSEAIWMIELENTGDTTVTAIEVMDTNGMTYGSIELGAGDTWMTTYAAMEDAYNMNLVTASGLDLAGQLVGPVTDTAIVDVFMPEITIEKTVDFNGDGSFNDYEMYYASSEAIWMIELENTGDTTVSGIEVMDTNGMTYGSIVLGVGDTWMTTYAAMEDAYNMNVATATGLDILGGPVGPVSDYAEVDVFMPGLHIEKTVDFDGDGTFSDYEMYYAGEYAIWKIFVENTGDTTVSGIEVMDTNGMTYGSIELGAGDTWMTTYSAMESAYNMNVATATGLDILGGPVGPVSDYAEVDVFMPELYIEKTVDFDEDGIFTDYEMNEPGEYAIWKIFVENTGDTTVSAIEVMDSNGMTYGSIELGPGDTWWTTYSAMEDAYNMNVATASGLDILGGPVGPVSDYAEVDVIVYEYAEETAWAYGGPRFAKPFYEVDEKLNNWGWTNGMYGEGHYELDIYAGAGQNDLSKGALVGTLIIHHTGDEITVSYELLPNHKLTEAHLYIGEEMLPMKENKSKGKGAPTGDRYINAPGQFEYKYTGEVTMYTFGPIDVDGEVYVAAHAVVWIPIIE